MNNVIAGSVKESFASFRDTFLQLNKKDLEYTGLDLCLKDTNTTSDKYAYNNAFTKEKTINFPEPLASIVHHPQAIPYKCGFLSDIQQVWLASNKSLYIWNFVSKNSVFIYECHEDIENVEVCVKENDLYVCTINSVFVHSFERESDGQLKILSNTKVRTDGVVMSNIYNTNTKRTFLLGNDGHLYEMDICRNSKGIATSIKNFTCLTEQPYMKYLSFIIRVAPEVPIKMISINDEKKVLYVLLKNSTIHAVDIQGSNFIYGHAFKADDLEYIQTIPSSQSETVDLIAVNRKGDRYYLSHRASGIGIVHKRLAPHVPGSLLFNRFVDERLHRCFYNSRIFASVCESNEKYLLLTCPNLMKTTMTQSIFQEDFYVEKADEIYMIMENESPVPVRSIEDVVDLFGKPPRQILTLNKNGITCYVGRRLVDRFICILATKNLQSILEFSDSHGTVETMVLCLLTGSESHEAASFLKSNHSIDEGLLLYASRLNKEIWKTNILKEDISLDIFEFIEQHLQKLLLFLKQANIDNSNIDIIAFIERCKEGASFTQLIHRIYLQDKDMSTSLLPHSPLSFEKLVSTEEGAFAAKDIILTCIKASTISSAANNYSIIGNFLSKNCSSLLGENNVIFYKGLECLKGARNEINKQPYLDQSLQHFKKIVGQMTLEQLKEICEMYWVLKDHLGYVKLALAKYQSVNPEQEPQVHEIIFSTEKLLDNSDIYSVNFVQASLDLFDQENYHYRTYRWLINHDQAKILTALSTSHIVQFLTTKLPKNEGYHYLFQYYVHQKEYDNAVETLRRLATSIESVTLENRIDYLEKACELANRTNTISEENRHELISLHKESKIQGRLRDLLSSNNTDDVKASIETLNHSLKPAKELFYNFACPNKLFEEALCLMDLMELYDWKYSKLAWTSIIEKCKQYNPLKEKLIDMGKRLYPSFISYPTYMLVHILDTHCAQYPDEFKDEFVVSTLAEVGVPQEIITEARAFKAS
ncbi:hypothetical protein G6F57_004500 [Rhizopus arrhizus]|uniref:Nucleoporin Nup133/Nup155-like N-terminal domain-containing protein n=1 Tax=Rhizopus oryzae TaxID=64495 RepID=A0A9P6XF30_RHIOR|nr:hypothetical protein G6F23_003006 [Rhizopus arrhizus]KAG1423890.1 hypothetical protein G6F58_002641 [Rhizopus delemar]KAG0764592.1 hypothetical protein G6F24_005093 [Rhizopus arrhizus]KAG0796753.1 hypothetical protein G6F21_001062 [Rhizopus arrhizus]KAG0816094.1 hypothetical protein G6F20_003478 [Rhizopus arrhizus]